MTGSPTADEVPLDPNDFWAFTEFAKHLGGLKPRVTLSWLKDRFYDACTTESPHVDLNGTLVLKSEMSELFCRNIWGAERISPDGAALLLRLHMAGVLLYKTAKPGPVAPEAQAYIDSKPALLAKVLGAKAEQGAYARKVGEPGSIREDEFTYRLLDDVFWKHQGKGGGALEIGGVLVHKSVHTLSSNSGKTHDASVRFTWRAADGTEKILSKPSAYEGNRRNDAERNWGLPE
jgi:hypothetical protein